MHPKKYCCMQKMFLFVFFSTTFNLRLRKFLGRFQNYHSDNKKNFCCRYQKKTSQIISIYGNFMTSIFSTKSFVFSMIHRMIQRKKFFENLMALFWKMFEICLINIFHRLTLWKCMTNIFGL